MKLDLCVSHNYTQRDLLLLPPSSSTTTTTTPAAAAAIHVYPRAATAAAEAAAIYPRAAAAAAAIGLKSHPFFFKLRENDTGKTSTGNIQFVY